MTRNIVNTGNKNRYYLQSSLVLLFLLAVLLTSNAEADNSTGIYTDVGLMYTQVKVNNGKFKPWGAKIKLGYNITKNFAIEGQYGSSFKDDSDQGVTVDLKQAMGAYIRWGSDRHNNVRIYVLLGQSRSKVDWKGPTTQGSDTLDGFSWAVGAEERSQKVKSMSYTAEYTSFYRKSGQEISGLSIGLRFEF